MKVYIGICDGSKEDIRTLSGALYAYDKSYHILEYTDSEFLIEDCVQNEILFDILFLEINMPGRNGIETAGLIREHIKDVKIIFITSSKEHYPEAYDVFAFNYIIKPVKKERLNRILDQALIDIAKERRQQICFSYKSVNHRIFIRDILYIESRDKIILFHLSDQRTLRCYMKLNDILMQLPKESFVRCHQSYVVNMYHVAELSENQFRIGKVLINISKKYRKASKDQYFHYLFTNINNRG